MRSAEQWPGKGRSTSDRVRAYGYGECYAGASLLGYCLDFCQVRYRHRGLERAGHQGRTPSGHVSRDQRTFAAVARIARRAASALCSRTCMLKPLGGRRTTQLRNLVLLLGRLPLGPPRGGSAVRLVVGGAVACCASCLALRAEDHSPPPVFASRTTKAFLANSTAYRRRAARPEKTSSTEQGE